MKRLTGRPPLGRAKRTKSVKVNFNDEEFDMVDIKSSRAGISRSEYVRQGALNAVVQGALSDEDRLLIYELKKLGANLNQIAHTGNAEGLFKVAIKAENLLDQMSYFILKLNKKLER